MVATGWQSCRQLLGHRQGSLPLSSLPSFLTSSAFLSTLSRSVIREKIKFHTPDFVSIL
jgi:hypothetical protein